MLQSVKAGRLARLLAVATRGSRGAPPCGRVRHAREDWKQVILPFSDLQKADGKGRMVILRSTTAAGPFWLRVDDVEMVKP